jgi:hypothetical protein
MANQATGAPSLSVGEGQSCLGGVANRFNENAETHDEHPTRLYVPSCNNLDYSPQWPLPKDNRVHVLSLQLIACANPLTVELTSLTAQQLTQLKKQLDTELEHLTTSFQSLRTAQSKFRDCLKSISTGLNAKTAGNIPCNWFTSPLQPH